MSKTIRLAPRKFRVYARRHLDKIPQLQHFSADEILAMKAVSYVLPFRVNDYVIDELIDWEGVPDDPSRFIYARSKMVPAFGNVSFALEVGEIGMAAWDKKQSPFGWHIIKRFK